MVRVRLLALGVAGLLVAGCAGGSSADGAADPLVTETSAPEAAARVSSGSGVQVTTTVAPTTTAAVPAAVSEPKLTVSTAPDGSSVRDYQFANTTLRVIVPVNPDPVEAEALAAWAEFRALQLASFDPPNPDHPGIDQWIYGNYRDTVRAPLAKAKAASQSLTGSATTRALRVISRTDTAIVVESCSDDQIAFLAADGTVATPPIPGVLTEWTTITLSPTGWKATGWTMVGDPCVV